MKTRLHNKIMKQGFTLTEVLISSFLSMLVIAGALTAFLQYRRTLDTQKTIIGIQQNLRVGATFLSRDISMAGYGLDLSNERLSQWLTWAPINQNPLIEEGSPNSSDSITVAGAYERVSSLTAPAPAGTTQISVTPGASQLFNLSNRKVIYIGECELARIVGISDNVLTVSSDPSVSKGLRYDHAAGAAIELVKVYEYTVDNSFFSADFPSCLRRTDLAGGATYWFQDVVSAGIEMLRFKRNGNAVDVTLRGRSTKFDPTHTDPEFGDHFHRLSISNSVCMRNL